MEKSIEAFTTGIWNVKKGKEKEFIKEWTELAKWSSKIYNPAARLLQDSEDPSTFVSIGKWNHMDDIQKWREKTEFKEAMSRISNLLAKPSKPRLMKEVVQVGDLVTV